MIRLIIVGSILILILGYIPPFKKYLPKNLQTNPRINCIPNKVGVKAVPSKGKLEKNLLSTVIPYKAQTGTIRYAPKNVGMPKLAVKAAGGKRMIVTNTAALAKKKNITLDGSPIDENTAKNMKIGSGCTITVTMKQQGLTYTCIPSQK